MNFKIDKPQKLKLISIAISAISIIVSFSFSINYLSWIAIILCGIPIFKECIEGLVTELNIKADLLVSIAIIASIIIGEIFAAGEISTIMAIGSFLEDYTVSKTQDRIEELVNITPQFTTRIKNNKEEKIPVDEIKLNDILKILPGESIPTDGLIIDGETSIDQSNLTGESMPIDKKADSEVYSGTINLYGSFKMKATKLPKDSSLQNLIALVETSQPENAKIVKTADKWATWIVLIAFSVSLLNFILTKDITKSVTVLVVFCPCALVLATPTAIMAGIGNLTKYGILVKDGKSIEQIGQINEFIFDKTGTLTYGTPRIIEIVSQNKEEMMYLLTSLESQSEHPLAKAIVKYYNRDNLAKVEDFKIILGKGVSGKINNDLILAGNEKLLNDYNITIDQNISNINKTQIYVVKNKKILGKVIFSDILRPNSKQVINELKNLEIQTTLLTGDNENVGSYIAGEVNVDNAQFDCMPEDKTAYISKRQSINNKVAMIGDGINDAPSLKKANVGISMGKIGSDISVKASDITLLNDNIADIPHLIKISRKTIKIININIAFSLVLNITAMILAILGIVNPISGALIHNIGSVIVIIYSATLIKYNSKKKESKKLGINKYLNKSTT